MNINIFKYSDYEYVGHLFRYSWNISVADTHTISLGVFSFSFEKNIFEIFSLFSFFSGLKWRILAERESGKWKKLFKK